MLETVPEKDRRKEREGGKRKDDPGRSQTTGLAGQ